jgi:hypothetical protein
VTEQCLDLVALQEVRLGRGHALHRDGCDLLADIEHLRRPGGDVLEEAVQRGEPLVAGANVVAALLFEVWRNAITRSQVRSSSVRRVILQRFCAARNTSRSRIVSR